MSGTGSFVDAKGQPVTLTLYMFPSCPFCRKVMAEAEALGLQLPLRDIHRDPAARDELARVGGKTTVPCLFIDGKPLYESADIIAYLEKGVRPA